MGLATASVLLLGACSDLVTDRIDAVARSGRLVHGSGEVRFGDAPAVRSLAPLLRKTPSGAALLDDGDAAVPGLIRLLHDPSRRTLAVVFLAEIGGDDAARELLRQWRAHRDDARSTNVYRQVGGGSWKLGYRYEGIDDEFYGELLMALGYAGLSLSPEIAKDTLAAIEEAERLGAGGDALLSREEREEDGRRVELRRWAAPVETAREGLRILALLRAPEAPAVFHVAMRSPVAPIRKAAVDDVLFLRGAADRLLPSLGPLLDDPDLSADAAEQVGFLLDDATTVAAAPIRALPVDRRAAVVGHCKERLRALGHLQR